MKTNTHTSSVFHAVYRGWTIGYAEWAGGYYAMRPGTDQIAIEPGEKNKRMANLIRYIDNQQDTTLGDLLEYL